MWLYMFIRGDVRRQRHLKAVCWCCAESVLSLFAAMLKQVQQLENSTDVSVKTAEELVSRNWTQRLVLQARVSPLRREMEKLLLTQTPLIAKHIMTVPISLQERRITSANQSIVSVREKKKKKRRVCKGWSKFVYIQTHAIWRRQ